jgi:ribulose-phosphate 3-epimerase
MMDIVPAILAHDTDTLMMRLRQAESFADCVQIDIMDGVFVPTVSFPVKELTRVKTSLFFEVHLMVQDPFSAFASLRNNNLKRVIFHHEAKVDHRKIIGMIQDQGMETGLAIKPETRIEDFSELVQYLDALLFLTVDPCCYGNPFKPEVLEKIPDARMLFPNTTIGVDGGVSLENLPSFFRLGVDYVSVGSRIFLEGNPGENYRHFVMKARELEGART